MPISFNFNFPSLRKKNPPDGALTVHYWTTKHSVNNFLMINKNSVDDFQIIWDAIKGFIRNNATAFASGLNKSQQKKISE